MTNTQQHGQLGPIFLDDFLEFLRYVHTHRIHTTMLHRHIPLHHLKDLGKRLRGKNPFHPLHSETSYEMRCQRDELRLDFMDMLAEQMELLVRSEWGYMLPARGWGPFMESGAAAQSLAIWNAYWTMDWDALYPWSETVDFLESRRTQILAALIKRPVGQLSSLTAISAEFSAPEGMAQGFFWVVIRPMEYLGAAKGHFQKDALGFWFPSAFELMPEFHAMQIPAVSPLDTRSKRPDTPAPSW